MRYFSFNTVDNLDSYIETPTIQEHCTPHRNRPLLHKGSKPEILFQVSCLTDDQLWSTASKNVYADRKGIIAYFMPRTFALFNHMPIEQMPNEQKGRRMLVNTSL
jgi:hypothetical protein